MSEIDRAGWHWFETATGSSPAALEDDNETARMFARAFAGRNGEKALAHLRSLTCDRFLGPEAGDAALRHLEGQRHLVAYVTALVERGRNR